MKAIANLSGTSTLRLVERPEPAVTAAQEAKLRVLRGHLRDRPEELRQAVEAACG